MLSHSHTCRKVTFLGSGEGVGTCFSPFWDLVAKGRFLKLWVPGLPARSEEGRRVQCPRS